MPAGIRPDSTYFPEIESLRGIAILLVVALHADGTLLFPFRARVGSWPAVPLAFVWGGHTGVTLFFVLSAFLLSMPFLQEAYGERRMSRRQFFARRALRILPLYYAAVVVGTIVTSTSPSDLWRGLPYFLFLEARAHLTTPMPPFSGVWWSLATEVQFYALLPAIALAFGRARSITLALLATFGVLYLAVACGFVFPSLEPWFRAQSIVGRGPTFLFGILAAWFYLRHGRAVRTRLAASRLPAGGWDMVLVVVLLALGCLLRWVTFHGVMALEVSTMHVWHVAEGALWTLVVLIVLLCPLRAKVLVSNRLLARLGVLSYSIYVLHQPVLRYTLLAWRLWLPHAGVTWNPTTTAWFALAVVFLVTLASLTYRFIERPFLVRKAKLGATASPATARAA
jgi:peptidoglycan/LPS O-acetylase OafA/YrhL